MSNDNNAKANLLTEPELTEAFRSAAESMEGAKARWAERAKAGLTDEQLEAALRYEFGTFGGSYGRTADVTFQGNGVKLWADHCGGSRLRSPTLEGKETVTFARRIYGIPNPDDKQLALF